MEPIAWGNAAVPDVFPAQNLLADQCHHDGVVHVVVGRITISNILQREARNEANDVRIGGLPHHPGHGAGNLAVLVGKADAAVSGTNISRDEFDKIANSIAVVDDAEFAAFSQSPGVHSLRLSTTR